MFDAGFSELVLLFVIALVILGPERLPKVAAQLGRWIGRARRTAMELRRQLEREVQLSEVTRPRPAPKPETPTAPPSATSEPAAGNGTDAPGEGASPVETRTEPEPTIGASAGDSAHETSVAPGGEAGKP